MNSKERVEIALRLEEPDRVPHRGPGFIARAHYKNPKAFASAGIRFEERSQSDFVSLFSSELIGVAYGCEYKRDHGETLYHRGPLQDKDATEWEKLLIPDCKTMSLALEALKILHKEVGDKLMISSFINDPCHIAGLIRGSSGRMMDMILNKELLHKGLERIMDFCLPLTEAYNESDCAFFGVEGGEDQESIFSLVQCKEFYWTYIQRLLKKAKELGMWTGTWGPGAKSPATFMKAGVEMYLPYLNEAIYRNTDLPFPEMMKEARTMKEWLRTRKVCMGSGLRISSGPDPPLRQGTVRDVIEQTKGILDTCAPGGGFILDFHDASPTDPLPKANIDAMAKCLREYGVYPFKKAQTITEDFKILY